MRNLLLFCVVLCSSITLYGQNATYRYQFNNNLRENYFKGPELNAHCSTGGYTWDALNVGISHNVFNFEKGCGLTFNDSADFLASGDYTIELYFKFDTTKGYKKIIDFDSMSKDPGLYNQNGKLVMYNNFTSPDSFFADDKYQYVAVTRNATSKNISLYYNDTLAGSLTDNSDQYVMDSNKLLIFFRDDMGTNGEQTGGAVAMIHISNYEMDATTLNNHYTNLSSILSVSGVDASQDNVHIYPNPANDLLHVVTTENCNYSIYDITGRILTTGNLTTGDTEISIGYLSSGVYSLRVHDMDGQASKVFKILKQ